jgi:hypothetical protein
MFDFLIILSLVLMSLPLFELMLTVFGCFVEISLGLTVFLFVAGTIMFITTCTAYEEQRIKLITTECTFKQGHIKKLRNDNICLSTDGRILE